MKIEKYYILLLLIFAFSSCSKTTGPVLPDVTTTEATLKNLRVSIISSDSLIIRNGDSLFVNAMDVVKISIFEEHEDSLVFLKTITPSYKNVGSLLRLEFLLPIKVHYPDYDKHFILQFKMSDNTIIDVKTDVHMYKYTYQNSEPFFRLEDFGPLNYFGDSITVGRWLIDFDIMDNAIYFTPGWIWAIYSYNFLTGESEHITHDFFNSSFFGKLADTFSTGGVHVTVTNEYLFLDLPNYIYRYNLVTDSTDIEIDLQQLENSEGLYLQGIEANNNSLFVLFEKRDNDNGYLVDYLLSEFTHEGIHINTNTFPPSIGSGIFNIDSYDGILYLWSNGTNELLRLDIGNNVFLKSLVAPSIWNDGFDIIDDYFYYGYYDIFRIELSELREVE